MRTSQRIAWGLGLPVAIVAGFFSLASSDVSLPVWKQLDLLRPALREIPHSPNASQQAMRRADFAAWLPLRPVAESEEPLIRCVSESGATYLVLSAWPMTYCGLSEASPRYVVARRAPGRARIETRTPDTFQASESGAGYASAVERGDDILQEGVLATPTPHVAVLNDGDFISFSNDGGPDVSVVIARHGRTSWFALGDDVFGNDLTHDAWPAATVGGLRRWIVEAGVDEKARVAWILGWNGKLYLLNIATGCSV